MTVTVAVLRAGVAPLAVLAALGTVGPPSGPGAREPEPVAPTRPDEVYRASCLDCHDGDGKGAISRDLFPKVPDFTDPRWQDARTDAELRRAILEGKGKTMPRMRSKLGSVGVARMVSFIRAFRGAKQVVRDEPEPGPAQSVHARPPTLTPHDRSVREGGRLYQRLCARCHGADGRGSEMRANFPSLPDFSRPGWSRGRRDPQLVVSVLEGKGSGMPPFRDKVGAAQARDLMAYVRAFAPSQAVPAATAPDDFEARFRRLQNEFDALSRQLRAVSPAPPRRH